MTVLDKTYVGVTQTATATTAGDYSAADNWLPISIRNGLYEWTASGSGTGEFYLDLAGGGDPGLAEPGNVQQVIAGVRTNLTAGSAGTLAASAWDYADNDTLGYSTIYVRLADDADPDSKSLDHVTLTAIPATGDHVRIPASSTTAISSGLDQRSVAIGDFIVEKGYRKNIGAVGTPLYIDPNRFEFEASAGASHIDIGTAAIDVQIHGTGSATTGNRGLYLTGSAIDECVVNGGSVGLAALHGQTATVASLRINGGSVHAGNGLTLTTLLNYGGTALIECAFTTGSIYKGQLTTAGSGAITTLNCYGGDVLPESTGVLTTLLVQGAKVDMTKCALARTVTNTKVNSGRFAVDRAVVTLTNWSVPDFPVAYLVSLPN